VGAKLRGRERDVAGGLVRAARGVSGCCGGCCGLRGNAPRTAQPKAAALETCDPPTQEAEEEESLHRGCWREDLLPAKLLDSVTAWASHPSAPPSSSTTSSSWAAQCPQLQRPTPAMPPRVRRHGKGCRHPARPSPPPTALTRTAGSPHPPGPSTASHGSGGSGPRGPTLHPGALC